MTKKPDDDVACGSSMTYKNANKVGPSTCTSAEDVRDVQLKTGVELDATGCRSLLPEAARTRFADSELEAVYTAHAQRMTWDTLFLVPLFSAYVCLASCVEDVIVFTDTRISHLIAMGVCLLVDALMVILLNVWTVNSPLRRQLPYLLYIFLIVQLFLDLGLQDRPISPSENLTWFCFAVYAAFTTLPIRYLHCVLLASVAAVSHLVVATAMSATSHYYYVFAIPNQVRCVDN